MLNLKDGTLWQWDLGRKVIITVDKGTTIDKVQFFNGIEDHAREGTIERDDEGNVLSAIPDGLLQYPNNLSVYLMTTDEDGVKTTEAFVINVNPRAKPEDYIFTDEEVRTYQQFIQRLEYLEDNLILPEDLEKVVDRYVTEEAKEILTADTKDNVVTFTSNDSNGSTSEPLTWLPVELLKSGEKHSSIFNKVSKMFQNIRYIENKALKRTDVVNNLVSTSADLPLSANQGKVLNEKTSKIRTYVGSDGKLHFVNASGADTVLNFSSGDLLKQQLYSTDLKMITSRYAELNSNNFTCILTGVSGATGPYGTDVGGSGAAGFNQDDAISYDASTGTINVASGVVTAFIGATTRVPYASANYTVFVTMPRMWFDVIGYSIIPSEVTPSSVFSTSYPITNATDKNNRTAWLSSSSESTSSVEFTFDEPFRLKAIRSLFCNSSVNDIANFSVVVEGSNDKSGWKPIGNINNITFVSFNKVSSSPVVDYDIKSDIEYQYYRFIFDKQYAGIAEVEFWGVK